MSDEAQKTETVEEFKEKVKAAAELEKLKQETNAKRAIINHKKASAELAEIKENEKDLELQRNANFGQLSPERIAEMRRDNEEYMEAAKEQMPFIDPTFLGIVPFFRKNFILVCGRTGDGKSTTVANIVFSTLSSRDPVTGRTRRVLVLTNEEKAEDFYNRVTCLIKGWHYTNHSKFTPEQRKTFDEYIPKLASNGRLTVIDNTHEGAHGVTTSVEGICNVFDNLIKNKEYYDAVIIDYYQNIIYSKEYPHMSENEVQARLTRKIDMYKNIYPAPIVMMAQITAPDKDGKIPFQQRIKGRKLIMDPSTFTVEVVADRENLRTKWVVHKSRFTESVGSDVWTGYNKGRYVKYDAQFAENVQRIKMDRAAQRMNDQIDKSNGIKDVFDKKDEEKKPEGT